MRFTDVTSAAGLSGAGYAIGAAAGDFDNDGHVDLFVAGARTSQLYRNRGDGRFEDVSKAAGIASGDFAVAGGWFDYDNDGRLDLLVVNYVQWSAGQESVLRRRGPPNLHLLPPAHVPGAAEPPLPQSGRPHVRGRLGASRPAGAHRQGHERVVRRLRPRRPPRHLHHQRCGAELSLPQQRRWQVHGNGAARRRVGAGHRPADLQHGRRCPGLRQRWLGGHPVHGADRGDVSALPQRVGETPRDIRRGDAVVGPRRVDRQIVRLVLDRRRFRQRRLEGHVHGELARQRSHRRFRSARVPPAEQPVRQRRPRAVPRRNRRGRLAATRPRTEGAASPTSTATGASTSSSCHWGRPRSCGRTTAPRHRGG